MSVWRRAACLACLLAWSSGGCSGGPSNELAVDLVTDLRPGLAFDRVDTAVLVSSEGSGPDDLLQEQREPASGATFLEPGRVAEFRGVPEGSLTVEVTLRWRGETVASRRVRLRLTTSQVVTVAITSDCAAVSCPPDGTPSHTECHGGRCVPPECIGEDGEGEDVCGEPECDADSDCDAMLAACASGRCRDGVCFGAPDDDACPDSQYCNPTRGCVLRPETPDDGGVPDGGDASMETLEVSIEDAREGRGTEVGARTVSVGDSLALYGVLRNEAGEAVGEAEVSWSVSSDGASVDPGPSVQTLLTAESAGTVTVTATHATWGEDEAGPFTLASCTDASECRDACHTSSAECTGGTCGYGAADKDADGDGAVDAVCEGGDDCDDDPAGCGAACAPDVSESCDGNDNDCDGTVDEGVGTTYYRDADGDGHGDSDVTLVACGVPRGYVTNAGDCDDASSSIHPGASELCNSIDDDCDGSVDEDAGSTYYRDADGDGYGDSSTTQSACSAPSGYVSDSSDCDDGDSSVHPGASEVCNGTDDDCDGSVDEGVQNIYYGDGDGDGYGIPTPQQRACSRPAGYVDNARDCDDDDASVHPGATEVCNGSDDDCDYDVDETFECVSGDTRPCNACGYSGVEQCTSCSWEGACVSGFSVDETFEGNDSRLSHGCGYECDADWCACASDCLVQDGPGRTYPPGRYRADFWAAPTDADTITFSVVDDTGAVLGSRTETYSLADHVYVNFTVPEGCPALDFRVRKTNGVCFRIYDTDIRRLGD